MTLKNLLFKILNTRTKSIYIIIFSVYLIFLIFYSQIGYVVFSISKNNNIHVHEKKVKEILMHESSIHKFKTPMFIDELSMHNKPNQLLIRNLSKKFKLKCFGIFNMTDEELVYADDCYYDMNPDIFKSGYSFLKLEDKLKYEHFSYQKQSYKLVALKNKNFYTKESFYRKMQDISCKEKLKNIDHLTNSVFKCRNKFYFFVKIKTNEFDEPKNFQEYYYLAEDNNFEKAIYFYNRTLFIVLKSSFVVFCAIILLVFSSRFWINFYITPSITEKCKRKFDALHDFIADYSNSLVYFNLPNIDKKNQKSESFFSYLRCLAEQKYILREASKYEPETFKPLFNIQNTLSAVKNQLSYRLKEKYKINLIYKNETSKSHDFYSDVSILLFKGFLFQIIRQCSVFLNLSEDGDIKKTINLNSHLGIDCCDIQIEADAKNKTLSKGFVLRVNAFAKKLEEFGRKVGIDLSYSILKNKMIWNLSLSLKNKSIDGYAFDYTLNVSSAKNILFISDFPDSFVFYHFLQSFENKKITVLSAGKQDSLGMKIGSLLKNKNHDLIILGSNYLKLTDLIPKIYKSKTYSIFEAGEGSLSNIEFSKKHGINPILDHMLDSISFL